MAIEGITDSPFLNEAGKIKIGESGDKIKSVNEVEFRAAVKLDHFIITTTEKADGNFVKDTVLMDKIKKNGNGLYNKNGDIIGIPIRLIYEDTENNFPHRLARNANSILVCHGDKKRSWRRIDNFTNEHTCPCEKLNDDYKGFDKCKYTGKLTCMIDDAELFGQIHVFRTAGYNSVRGILGGINLIKTVTGGKICGLPLMLTVNNKSVTPSTGKRTTVQVVSVCYRGSTEDVQAKCLELAEKNKAFLIGMRNLETEAVSMGATVIIPDDEYHDYQEEFYPNSVMDAEFSTVQEERPSDDNKEEFVQSDKSEDSVNGFPIVHPFLQKAPAETPEVVNSRDLLTPAQQEEAAKSQEKAKKDVQQLGFMNRIQSTYDRTESLKLIKRLDKEYLIKFLKNMGEPSDLPDEKENKPVFVESAERLINSDDWVKIVGAFIAKDKAKYGTTPTTTAEETETATTTYDPFLLELAALNQNQPEMVAKLRKRFPDTVINGTLPPEELIRLGTRLLCGTPEPEAVETPQNKDLEKQVVTLEKNTPDQDEESPNPLTVWDDGGPVTEPQMAQIAQLKGVLKIKDFSEWSALVGRYKDRNGESLPLAANMTSKQAKNFICELNLKADGIPF